MKRLLFAAVAPFALIAPTACGGPSDPELSFSQARVRAPLGGRDVTAAYLTIANAGAADRLISAEAAAAGVVELHTHVRDGDRMRMERVEAIEIPAGGEAALSPGGDHIMLFEVEGPLEINTYQPIALTFENTGDRIVYALVVEDPTEVIEEPHDHDGDGVPDHAPGDHVDDHDHDHGDHADEGEADHDHGDHADEGEADHDHGDHAGEGEADHDHGDHAGEGEADHDHGDHADEGEADHDHGDHADEGEEDPDNGR